MVDSAALDQAVGALGERAIVVISGAGVSTDSGIPDYRGPGREPRTPMNFATYLATPEARRRYWARAHVGWERMARARPNPAHVALARLERAGTVSGLITQNVDGLHAGAGSRRIVELHGRIADVTCLSCGQATDRSDLHQRQLEVNPGFADRRRSLLAPDGDVDLAEDDVAEFVVPGCVVCGGDLKPDVVFFGENVPVDRVRRCYRMVESAEALLVVGSSLTVHSGRRFVVRAAELRLPIVIVNRGPTRSDHLATVRISDGATQALRGLLPRLLDPAVGQSAANRAS